MSASTSPVLYQHQLDRCAFDALCEFPEFQGLVQSYSSEFDETMVRAFFLSGAMRLGETQMPEVYGLLRDVCDKLEIAEPELYCVNDDQLNAGSFGDAHPCIFLSSGIIAALDLKRLACVIAHECGHIACAHAKYRSIARILEETASKPSSENNTSALRLDASPQLLKAIRAWDRASELSADRASILYMGECDTLIDTLLCLAGFNDADRDAFIKQASDLQKIINSVNGQAVHDVLFDDEEHPSLAVRIYEAKSWTESNQFQKILDGTYSEADLEAEKNAVDETEIIAAEVTFDDGQTGSLSLDEINARLANLDGRLKECISEATLNDYAYSCLSGIVSGLIDSFYVGEISFDELRQVVQEKVDQYVKNQAVKISGSDENRELKTAIGILEKNAKVPNDNAWSGKGIGVSTLDHHLADIAHHPTPLGLAAFVFMQFFRCAWFVNKEGKIHVLPVETNAKDRIVMWGPAILSGVFNWLAWLVEENIEGDSNREVPPLVKKLIHVAASSPILISLCACANQWFDHLISDMDGSSGTPGEGMGIPGLFLSFLYELSWVPPFNKTGIREVVHQLYTDERIDLREEIEIAAAIKKQTIPVIVNEILVRTFYFVTRLIDQTNSLQDLDKVDWDLVLPFGNRTVERMMTVASMTLSVADTADAAAHAALESGFNWLIFSRTIVARFNYVAAGRAAVCIYAECKAEQRESQLIHEKMILSEAKTSIFLDQLQSFKDDLDLKLSNYLAENISAFMEGFALMEMGFDSGDSDLVIKGNVVIQRMLGREPQFTSQEEFDALMESDEPLVL